MKFLILFSTILLTLTQNNLLVDACLPIYKLLADININNRLPLTAFLTNFRADNTTQEGFYQLHECFSALTLSDKLRHTALETKIALSPQCTNN
ncbi:secretoglobin family 2B member 2 [Notamacropus eugenii]|uniref:secretoglobin family 2B member 2 n=1 Tax=Notamacropus eugenii TaxID=9315 RepID=UPI003B685A36